MTIRVVAFDAYGTLFDVTAAARNAAADPRFEALCAKWEPLAQIWRDKQLAYTWLRAVAGAHADFWQVTAEALDYALEATGLDGDAALRQRLLDLYRDLDAYSDARASLQALRRAGLNTAILSNGAPDMLDAAVRSAALETSFDAVLSAQSAGIFKPSPKVYDLVGQRFDIRPAEVLFVSSNGWDAAGAAGYGFTTAWVNRAGLPLDRLPWQPHFTLPDLTGLAEIATRR